VARVGDGLDRLMAQTTSQQAALTGTSPVIAVLGRSEPEPEASVPNVSDHCWVLEDRSQSWKIDLSGRKKVKFWKN
jgi:hypothetical protein